MIQFIKKFWPQLLTLLPLVLLFFAIIDGRCVREKKAPVTPTPTVTPPMVRDTIRDTVEVVTQQVIVTEKVKEVISSEDKQLLKDLGTRLSAVESYQKIGMKTEAAVTLSPDTSLAYAEEKGSSRHQDSVLAYHDAWMDLKYNTINQFLLIQLRDSLAIAVEKEHKHRFLWWRWGTKGYSVKVANFNPHSTVTYNKYIRKIP